MNDTPLNLADLADLARESLPEMAWGYYADGARDQVTLGENPAAWQSLRFRPRMLMEVERRSLMTRVLGRPQPWPLVVAPMAFQGMAHPDGEVATARAAGMSGVPMVCSTLSLSLIHI